MSITSQLTPDNEGAIVRAMVWMFGIDWKTSFSGFMSLLIATFGPLTGFLASLALLMPGKWPLGFPIATLVVSTLAGIMKAWVGVISKDSGTQAVTIPGIPDTVGVPSHEVPNVTLPPGSQVAKP